MISLIAAIGKNNELGKGNTLLWHMLADMRFFREKTRGHSVIMGRKTYDVAKGFEKEPFAGKEVIVFSRKRDGCANDPVKASMQLKKKKGKNIWLVGGSQIISTLMNAGLVDEIINSVHPVIIGNGIPLFDRIAETSLKLINTKRFPSGLVQLHYDVKMRK